MARYTVHVDYANAPKGTYQQAKDVLAAAGVDASYARPDFAFDTDDDAVVAAVTADIEALVAVTLVSPVAEAEVAPEPGVPAAGAAPAPAPEPEPELPAVIEEEVVSEQGALYGCSWARTERGYTVTDAKGNELGTTQSFSAVATLALKSKLKS